jgi:2-oxoglutarate dehydrogenase E2 component (dihydrolipoamide succinyltransferase)
MPKLADTLVEGTLGRWLKQVGESVGLGEPLASIETDKVTTDLSSPAAGTLLEILVSEGQTVAIETPIARIGTVSEARPGEAPPAPPAETHSAPPAEAPAAPPLRPTPAVPPRKPTPVAARLLAEHGLTVEQVPARSSRVTRDDVLNFVQTRPAIPDDLVPLSSMRRAIADHMTRARQSIPHGQSVMAADLTRVVAWRDAHKDAFQQSEGANLTFTVLFVFALARELARVVDAPVDVGVAVAIEAGLIVPVLRAADQLSLPETARGVADLANRARARQLRPDETQGARMTVTNVGSFGNLTAAPIVPLGQLGILGPGLVEPRPLPGPEGGIRPGWQCLLSLMFDRRAFDDFAADRFLRGVIDQLLLIPTAALLFHQHAPQDFARR